MRKDMNELVTRDGGMFGLFEPLFDDFFDFPTFQAPRKREWAEVMKTDVREGENDYKIDIDMPGYKKEDVNMTLDNGYLTVSAKHETKVDDKDKSGNYIRRERHYGSCTRSFYVGDVKQEDINAKMENGLLEIVVPKETKKIETKKTIEIK